MLKAQMLATALDVYFDRVVESVNVDLTMIPHPVTSTNYPATTDAWGTDTCQSVEELLAYAANQYLAAGVLV